MHTNDKSVCVYLYPNLANSQFIFPDLCFSNSYLILISEKGSPNQSVIYSYVVYFSAKYKYMYIYIYWNPLRSFLLHKVPFSPHVVWISPGLRVQKSGWIPAKRNGSPYDATHLPHDAWTMELVVYESLDENHKNQLKSVGKYTSPMDDMGPYYQFDSTDICPPIWFITKVHWQGRTIDSDLCHRRWTATCWNVLFNERYLQVASPLKVQLLNRDNDSCTCLPKRGGLIIIQKATFLEEDKQLENTSTHPK